MRPTLQFFFVWVGKKTVEKLEKYSISGFLQILQPVLDFCGFNHFLDFGMVFFSTKAKKKTRSNHCTVPLVWIDCKNYIYIYILPEIKNHAPLVLAKGYSTNLNLRGRTTVRSYLKEIVSKAHFSSVHFFSTTKSLSFSANF